MITANTIQRFALGLILLGFALVFVHAADATAQVNVPTIGIELNESDQPEDMMPAMKIVGMLTILSIAPAILLMMTSFTRILVILSFVRQALGT